MDINNPQPEYYEVSSWIDTPSYDHRNGNLGSGSILQPGKRRNSSVPVPHDRASDS